MLAISLAHQLFGFALSACHWWTVFCRGGGKAASGYHVDGLRTPLAQVHLRMAARYQHLSPAFLAEALGKFDAVFSSLNAENGREHYQDVTWNLALSE
jgi:hypothetical protein